MCGERRDMDWIQKPLYVESDDPLESLRKIAYLATLFPSPAFLWALYGFVAAAIQQWRYRDEPL